MAGTSGEEIRYRRNRFSARLPAGHLYSHSHFWLGEAEPGTWRVGLTSFATRMLGEIVEFDVERREGERLEVGEVVGWIEGFKAVSDLYTVAAGVFSGINSVAAEDTEIVCRDPYRSGWLYAVRGDPDPDAVDVNGYVAHLDRTIDRMLEQPWKSAKVGGS